MVSNIINDVLVVKEIPGRDLLAALEYSSNTFPENYEASFLLVSGIKYTYDYRKTPKIQSVEVCGHPLDLDRNYSVATFLYIASGGDGYTMMKDHKYLVDEITGIETLSLLLKFFKGPEEISFKNHGEIKKNFE